MAAAEDRIPANSRKYASQRTTDVRDSRNTVHYHRVESGDSAGSLKCRGHWTGYGPCPRAMDLGRGTAPIREFYAMDIRQGTAPIQGLWTLDRVRPLSEGCGHWTWYGPCPRGAPSASTRCKPDFRHQRCGRRSDRRRKNPASMCRLDREGYSASAQREPPFWTHCPELLTSVCHILLLLLWRVLQSINQSLVY